MRAKKGLSVLLSLCMLFSLFPTMAFAADSEGMDASTVTVEASTTEVAETEPGNEEKDEAGSALIQPNDAAGAPTDDNSELDTDQDSNTREYTSLDEAKYTPGAFVQDENGHHQRIGTGFDFVEGDVAYSYVTDENGTEVTVSPWNWYYACDNGCGESGHTSVVPHTLYSGYQSGITIEATVTHNEKSYTVVGVDGGTFAHVSNSVVTLPEGIQTIGMEAFYNYRPGNNQTFQVPASVTEIGDACFGACGVPITFAEGSQLKTVGKEAFYNLSLPNTELVLPDGVETLGDSLLNGSELKSVTIPGTVTNLTSAVLNGYNGTINFTDGAANFSLQDGVLYGYGKLIEVRDKDVESITVPDDVREIGPQAFQGLKKLTSITLPESLTTIGYGAFSGCSALTSIVIPEGVTELPAPVSSNTAEGLFASCTSLKTVEIKGQISEIPAYAFQGCKALETVSYPDSVTRIGESAFFQTPRTSNTSLTLDFSNIEEIGDRAFQRVGIKELSAPSLKKVGASAFQNGGALQTAIIPASVESIGDWAFSGAFADNATLLMQGEIPPELGEEVVDTEGSNGLTVYYPAASKAAYQTAGLIDEEDTNGYALNLTDAAMILTTAKAADGNNTLTLKTVTVPEGMTLEATSSNTGVATVTGENGKLVVTGVSEGTATITATLKVDDYVVLEDTCTVTVTAEGAVVPTVEEPKVDVDSSIDSGDKATVTEVANSVGANETIISAAKDAAADLDGSAEKETLIAQGKEELSPGDGDTVSLYTQTYLDIKATKVEKDNNNVTSITLNITPVVQVVASTADNSADISIKDEDNTNGNAVVVKDPQTLTITTSSEITVKLPDSFARKLVYVKHEASNGTYFYKATADDQGEITFTSTHGFSPFTFSLTNEAVAEVNGIGYASFQEAVNAAGDNDTVEVVNGNADLTATMSGSSRTITVKNSTGDKITVTINSQAYSIASGEAQSVEYTRPSSGGGSSSSTRYTVSVEDTDNGTVKVSPTRASKGSTVTITVTPDEGYELDKLIVTDKNGDKVKLTDKGDGKYTFKMPASKITVEATFAEIGTEPETPVFTDVPADAYYADAVKWAVENGVTEGTSATTFSPDMSCTRAQMVTFLWRQAGAPKATSSNPFTDVQAGSYYYDAVLWAVEQGITSGTSATTFAPDATCTRAQTVTFLYRAAGSPAVSGGSFSDVSADAYYADAVAWAVSEGVTVGTSDTTFSPDMNCTRAQIVTFMYRAEQ